MVCILLWSWCLSETLRKWFASGGLALSGNILLSLTLENTSVLQKLIWFSKDLSLNVNGQFTGKNPPRCFILFKTISSVYPSRRKWYTHWGRATVVRMSNSFSHLGRLSTVYGISDHLVQRPYPSLDLVGFRTTHPCRIRRRYKQP